MTANKLFNYETTLTILNKQVNLEKNFAHTVVS